tara:strand:- start:581 stop:2038 length:1458 start_codon:yes stop_codon:yes gene_type:complete
MILSDAPAERAILSGICRYGSEAYYEVASLITEQSFTIESNEIIYGCLKHILEDDHGASIDLPAILSAAKEIGMGDFLIAKEEVQHLSAIMKFPVQLSNVRKFAVKIKKLQIAREMYDQLELTKEKYLEIKGDEPIGEVLGIAEESIFEFTERLSETDDTPQKVFSDVSDRLEELTKNPIDIVGIPTGFKRYDFAIGGGLRKGTVNVIGARPKTGKTLFAENAGIHIAKQGIPVLNLDTEMTKQDHQDRGMAMLTEVGINEIETGKFVESNYKHTKLMDMAKEVKDIPYYHKSIGGMPLPEQLSIIRRWLAREVGINDQGKANNCVIIYDYLKIMDSAEIKGDMKEYQVLGFLMSSLHNFAIKYEIPVLAFVQLNRDGITKESTDTASGSDRIIWLCSNFTIYKRKSDEEIAKDGPENGNRKLVPVIARHGEGLEPTDYININMIGKYGKLTEGKTAKELESGGSVIEDEDQEESVMYNEDIPFV